MVAAVWPQKELTYITRQVIPVTELRNKDINGNECTVAAIPIEGGDTVYSTIYLTRMIIVEEPVITEPKEEEPEMTKTVVPEPESDLTEIEDEPSPNWFPWFPATIITGAIGVFLWILWKSSRVTIHGALTESDGAFRVVKTDGDKNTAELLQETIDRLHAECRFDLASYLNEAFGSGYVTKIPSRTKITITDVGSGTATSIRADEKKLYEILQKAEEQKAHVLVSFVYDNTSAELEFDFTEE